ncbi:hypothetical protein MTsPCn5_15130 [Croceitalea sp. MTPC5]|nr:hypothetical protein MTsPCn5_15130 [Croceitalea sp. MTPC5]
MVKLITDLVLVLGMILTFLEIIILLRLKIKQLPHKILIFFWVFILGTIINFYATLYSIKYLYIATTFIESGVRLFLAPLLFLYVKSIFIEKKGFFKIHLWHFIPFLIFTSFMTFPRVINIVAGKEVFTHVRYIITNLNLALIKDIYFVLYGMFSLRVLNKYQKVSKQNYAVEIEHNLKWLYTFLICFVGVIVIDLILTISEITLGYIVLWDGYITVFALICSISYLGYCGLKQAVIDLPDFLVKKNNYKSDKKKIRILNPEQKKELEGLKLELEKVMNEKKPYLSQDITLQKLADSINISERKLSLLLSDTMKTSFYNLINKYRVEDVKKKLHSTEYSEYSLEGIGYSSGFNSKSSFYRIFKKETQLSPLQFKQKLS